MATIKNRITIGKIIVTVGLLYRIIAIILAACGSTLISGTWGSVIGVILLAGGLVVYAMEDRKPIQRVFAVLCASCLLISLISIENSILLKIILLVQLISLGMLVFASRRKIRKIIGIAIFVGTLLIFVMSLGYGNFGVAVETIIIVGTYALIILGNFI